jgi:hypothetical protein
MSSTSSQEGQRLNMFSGSWFSSKRYGYGASLPLRKEGWIVIALMALMVLACAIFLRGPLRLVGLVGVVAVFLVIVKLTTAGGWRWRWGGR